MRVMVGVLGMVWAMVAVADPLAPLRANPQLCAAVDDLEAQESCLQKAGVTSFSRKGRLLTIPLASGKKLSFKDKLTEDDSYSRYVYRGFDFRLQRHVVFHVGYEWSETLLIDAVSGQTLATGDDYVPSPDGRWLAEAFYAEGELQLSLRTVSAPRQLFELPVWPGGNASLGPCKALWQTHSEVLFQCQTDVSTGEKPRTINGRAQWQANRWLLSGALFVASPEVLAADAEIPRGMKITAVRPSSPAALAGIEPGWSLLRLNGRPITSVEDARAVNAEGSKAAIHALLQRQQQVMIVAIPPHSGTLGLDLCLPEKCR